MPYPFYNKRNVSEHLLRLLENECPYAPLTDTALASIIEEEGEECSIGLISNLRGILSIPNSHKRKRRAVALKGKTNGR